MNFALHCCKIHGPISRSMQIWKRLHCVLTILNTAKHIWNFRSLNSSQLQGKRGNWKSYNLHYCARWHQFHWLSSAFWQSHLVYGQMHFISMNKTHKTCFFLSDNHFEKTERVFITNIVTCILNFTFSLITCVGNFIILRLCDSKNFKSS